MTSGVDLGPTTPTCRAASTSRSRQDIVEKVFPCRRRAGLLCHVRKVDLHDTELALGDDDGYLAVVLSNRLPQPAAPQTRAATPHRSSTPRT